MFLAIVFLIAGIGQCAAMQLDGTEKLVWIDGNNADNYARYTEIIGRSIIEGSLPDDQETAEKLKTTVWNEVRCGERNLLLMLTPEKAYVGHIYYSVQTDKRIVRFATPCFANKAKTVAILSAFFKALRGAISVGSDGALFDITFILPENHVPVNAGLIQLFGFERNDSIIPVGHADKYYSEKIRAEWGELQGFILPASTEIK